MGIIITLASGIPRIALEQNCLNPLNPDANTKFRFEQRRPIGLSISNRKKSL
ncbi:uncharacterized protein METZ01_LOCUS88916 [marine metagenome]|jgi:hypothetical protein|uniref:Uncharacterized protein n=1 Tax=marine metagenome TaxID=408172 RepID=A0A381V6R1_9ZZZZ|tara:strand:- start:93 stop:248 length:156 start_codon:yes stop_codon:yes gene_type:complete